MTRAPEPRRVYLLSPAHCGGVRARLLLRDGADFPLARALRSPRGAPLGELFAFTSGLYFRGKLAYATAFAHPPPGGDGVLVIVPGRGLVPAGTRVRLAGLRRIAAVRVDEGEPRYLRPLLRDARRLAALLGPDDRAVLLGSIATGKYADPLLAALGPRLHFPRDFVGRGDMSRGGLLLRRVDAGRPLAYVPLSGAVRRGARPARLEARRRLVQSG